MVTRAKTSRPRRPSGQTGRRRRNTGPTGTSLPLREDLERLNSSLKPFCLTMDEVAQERMFVFANELLGWNDRLNLLSRPDAPNVIRKHVSASLGVFLLARPISGERWIDVGTGAGFPGMILKMVSPEMDITLLDSARKRCLFLDQVSRAVGMETPPIVQMRVETYLGREGVQGSYDVVTARAVASLEDSLVQFGPLLKPSGLMVTFKGPQWREEVDRAAEGGVFDDAGFSLESAIRIPWARGHVLSLRKSAQSIE